MKTHALERPVARTGCTSNSAKRSIMGGDFNMPQVDCNGKTDARNVNQVLINYLVFINGFRQVTEGPTRGDSILDVYLVRPESS